MSLKCPACAAAIDPVLTAEDDPVWSSATCTSCSSLLRVAVVLKTPDASVKAAVDAANTARSVATQQGVQAGAMWASKKWEDAEDSAKTLISNASPSDAETAATAAGIGAPVLFYFKQAFINGANQQWRQLIQQHAR